MPVRRNQYKDSGSNVGKGSWSQKVTIILIHQELWYTEAITLSVRLISITWKRLYSYWVSFMKKPWILLNTENEEVRCLNSEWKISGSKMCVSSLSQALKILCLFSYSFRVWLLCRHHNYVVYKCQSIIFLKTDFKF